MAQDRDDQHRRNSDPNARTESGRSDESRRREWSSQSQESGPRGFEGERHPPNNDADGRSGRMGFGGVGGGYDSQHFDVGQRSGAYARSEDRYSAGSYGGSFGAGQSGGGPYANPHTREGGGQGGGRYGAESGRSTGGQSNQGYYGGGQMGDRNYGGGNRMAGSEQGGSRPDERDFGRGSMAGNRGPTDSYGNRRSMLSHRQGHPQSWGEAQEDSHQHQDQQYFGRREQQRRQLDRDYEEFRQHRQERFNAEFDEWRKNRSSQGSNAQTGTGMQGGETERSAPGISTDKKSDDTKA